MATATPRADEPESAISIPSDCLYEVVHGQVVEKPAFGALEADIAFLLAETVSEFARSHRLGRVYVETLFRIDKEKDLQRRPDVAFVSHERWPFNQRPPRVNAWDLVPDLAVEVISPSTMANELAKKVQEYFHAGVRRVWVIYPSTREVHDYYTRKTGRILKFGDEVDGESLIPGFRMPVRLLFEDPPQ